MTIAPSASDIFPFYWLWLGVGLFRPEAVHQSLGLPSFADPGLASKLI